MNAGEKVQLAREMHRPRWSQRVLAERSGVPKHRIASWEARRSEPTESDIRLVASVLRIDVDWFWSGDDTQPAFKEHLGVGSINPPGHNPPTFSSTRAVQPGVGRRLFPLRHSAGAASFPLDSGTTEDAVEFSDELVDNFRTQYAIQVWGDSANPEIRHGDYLLISEDASFRYPGFYVLVKRADGTMLVKTLAVENGEPVFRSTNPNYPDVPADDGATMIGFAIGWKRDNGRGVYIEAGHKTGLRPGFLGL